MGLLYGRQFNKNTPPTLGEYCTGQVDRFLREQAPDDVKDHIRPEVDTRRSDQSIFHIAFARDESDDPVQEEDLNQ